MKVFLAYFALLFAGLGSAFIVWVIANKVEEYYSCSRFVNLLHPACVATNKIMLSLRLEALTLVVTATTSLKINTTIWKAKTFKKGGGALSTEQGG